MCAAALTITTLLAAGGCANRFAPERPAVGPWAYEFQLGQFKDARPDDEALLRASVPFTTNSFMLGWQHSVGRSIFNNTPAKLDVTLHEYDITSSGSSYAMNMDVSLRGRDMDGRTLATMNGKCNAIVWIDGGAWGDFWQQAKAQGTTTPLTAAARNATMWQKVMDSCVAELAKQFDTSLAAGAR